MSTQENYNKFIKKLESMLKEELFDQNLAVESLTKTLLESHILNNKKLQALFTFIGPANSGKHYLSELLAKLSPDIKQLKTFYMDQYSGTFGFGAEQLGVVSFQSDVIEFIQNNPSSVLVFEDIERADLQVQLALYTLFTDYEKNELDLSNVIVIVTTTCLSSLLQRKDVKKILQNDPLQAHTFLMEKLSSEQIVVGDSKESAFDRKLLSLLAEHATITFNKLSIDALIKIGARALHQMSQDFIKESGTTIEYERFDIFVSLLTLSLAPYLNARHIKQKLPKQLFDHIYEVLKQKENVTQISFSVSKKAQSFIEKALKDEELLIKKISKQHKRISLEWEIIPDENKTVQCIIKDAFYSDEELSVTQREALSISEITFKDIAGHNKVKEQLLEIVALLKEPERLKHFDLEVPKGMILYGPVGMGKKLLARAFACESNMPYTVISGSDLFVKKNIQKAYLQAYGAAPAIVILEDIDIQGILNGMISTMSIEPLVEQLDTLHQSFESPVFTIITISSHANIPVELLQAKRIDIQIEVPKLDIEAREFFIKEALKKPHDKNIDIDRIVRYISGMGGNELKRIGEEGALFAARKGLTKLTEEILLEQINIIKYGNKLENKQIRDVETSMAKTAYHEAGHAVLSYMLLPKNKIEQVTVAPRSEALGFTSYHSDDYVDSISKDDIFNEICVLLGGRIAKMQKFGEKNGMETGAVNDLEAATMQIFAAITIFGMDEELGYINLSGLTDIYAEPFFKEKIEARIAAWVEKATKKTKEEVVRLWPAIDVVAQTLMKKEVIDGEELKEIVESNIKK